MSTFRMFDARVEDGSDSVKARHLLRSGKPGQVVAKKHKAILIKAGDGNGVWIGQMKKNTKKPALKLPALDALQEHGDTNVPDIPEPSHYDDVRVRHEGAVCYVNFDFYNGAMSTEQARRLEGAIEYVKTLEEVQLVALMGGERFFSTGINLVTIENSPNKYDEAWSNINAINDVIKSVVTMTTKATVAVLQGNAGAGGTMFAAACDLVVAHPGVLLTPSYKNMHLHGSEYWTYFLPQRVGSDTASRLVSETTPLSVYRALDVGLINHVIGKDKASFYEELPIYLKRQVFDSHVKRIVEEKTKTRTDDWLQEIQRHREEELNHMAGNFRSEEFLTAMHKFVYHLP